MATFTSQADLEKRITAPRVAQLFDDDGDGAPDAAIVTQFENEADQYVRVFLESKGFTRQQLNLIATNEDLRGAAADIFAGLGGERKTEWLNDAGKGLFEARFQRGKEMLRMLASGELRIMDAGVKPNITGRLTAPDPVYVIAPSAKNPKGSGGF